MKTLNLKQKLIMAPVILMLLVFASSFAHATEYGYTEGQVVLGQIADGASSETDVVANFYCRASDDRLITTGRPTIWAVLAANYVGSIESSYQGCRDHIDFEAGRTFRIQMEVLLKAGNTASNGTGGKFVFGPRLVGADDFGASNDASVLRRDDDGSVVGGPTKMTEELYNAGRAKFVVSGYNNEHYFSQLYVADTLPTDPCIIRIAPTLSDIVVQNIRIEGSNAKTADGKVINGICVEGNNVILKNVQVDNMSGAGILVDANARGLAFEGDFNAVTSNNSGGIVVMGADNGIGRDINIYNNLQGILVDESNNPFLIKTNAQAYVDLSKEILTIIPGEEQEEDGNIYKTWLLQGIVTNCDTSGRDENNSCVDVITNENYAEYGVPVTEIKFFYVDDQGEAGKIYELDSLNLDSSDTETDSSLLADNFNKGLFLKTISVYDIKQKLMNDYGIENPRVSNTPWIFIMAVNSDNELFGPTSVVKKLSTAQDGIFGTGSFSSGGGTYFRGTDGRLKLKAITPQECDAQFQSNWVNVNIDFNADTDGDGIYDRVEMSLTYSSEDGSFDIVEPGCALDGRVSYWNDPDSDDDGIPDGQELFCYNGDSIAGNYETIQKEIGRMGSSSSKKLCGIERNAADKYVTPTGSKAVIRNDDMPDTDGSCGGGRIQCDYKPNTQDDDSDGDGKSDYVEDRAKLYRGTANVAFYYEVGSGDTSPYQIGEERVRCDVDSTEADDFIGKKEDGYDSDKGVYNGVYVIRRDREVPLKLVSGFEFQDGDMIKTLACKNASLNAKENFDGIGLDGADCSDLRDPSDRGECRKTCVDGEVLAAIADPDGKYMDDPLNGKLVLANNGVPLLFQDVIDGVISDPDLLNAVYCGDFDSDGIPNCVEALVAGNSYDQIGRCDTDRLRNPAQPVTRNEYALNFLLDDSDGDTLKDGYQHGGNPDVCPEHKDNDCDPYVEVYTRFPILAAYLDRDGDRLRDVLEFAPEYKDGFAALMDSPSGEPNPKLKQSDPLNAHSDKDQLEDYVEWQIGTDPTKEDTDGDGIDDYTEIAFDGDAKHDNHLVGDQYTCGTFNVDTDPLNPDTDGDGIKDGIEYHIMGTSPNDIDSDNDGLCDGNQAVTTDDDSCFGFEIWYVPDNIEWERNVRETDPCNKNSDGDQWTDGEEYQYLGFGCGNIGDDNCTGIDVSKLGTPGAGLDSDGDGLPDDMEAKIGTDALNEDTDGDKLVDGCVNGLGELCVTAADDYRTLTETGSPYSVCTPPDFMDCDTDPREGTGYDTDGDGLNDYLERMYPTDPQKQDTDNDCLIDGVEDKDQNGRYDSGETRAASPLVMIGTDEDMFAAIDTDDDGIPDGLHPKYKRFGCEDCDCSGDVTLDADGFPVETSPVDPDSDGDGRMDGEEMRAGTGYWNQSNIGHALTARKAGCSLSTNGSGDWMMIVFFAAILLGISLKKKKIEVVKS